ncbi:MAG: nitroreductase family protein [Coriobacteriia bacterium]|nr:nitroreductase family protein [Coriobacteriia bacterium]MBN2821883.1 nitroreductase family protein [Coriobacteriia bacterium]
MELKDALRARHSVRVFSNEPVDESVVRELIEYATLAPSTFNLQPWHFHVATGASRDAINQVIAQTTQYLREYVDKIGPEAVDMAARFYADLGGAPVVIGISAPVIQDELIDSNNICLSIGACIENFLLLAMEAGLGACNLSVPEWVASDLMETFGVPEGRALISIMILGVPDEVPVEHEHQSDVITWLR